VTCTTNGDLLQAKIALMSLTTVYTAAVQLHAVLFCETVMPLIRLLDFSVVT